MSRSPGPSLEVSGGRGGITANIDDLLLAATRLDALADQLREGAASAQTAVQPLGSFSSRILDPEGLRAAERAVAVAFGPPGARWIGSVGRAGSALSSLADKLRATAALYAVADRGAALGFLLSVPGLIEGLIGGAPTLVGGVVPIPGLDSAPELARVLAAAAGAAGRVLSGQEWLPDNGRGALAAKPAERASAGARPPGGVAALISRIPPSTASDPRVKIDRVDGPGGRRWIVTIPGTDSWPLVPGRSPFDGAGALGLAGLRRTAGMDAVEKAMRTVRIRPGEPVLLAGHSQGGMLAAAVAADPAVVGEFTITHVVTVGSPIAPTPIPDDVQVLSIEHREDVVPKLDGQPNPDRPNWTTVTADLPAEADLGDGHDRERYVATGALVDASPDPSIRGWAGSARDFFDRPGSSSVTWTVHVRREP